MYFFPFIVNVTSVSELQQEKQHVSTSVFVLHDFADTEMYLFVVLCQDCLVNEVIERFSLCLIERIREGITFTLDLGNGPS